MIAAIGEAGEGKSTLLNLILNTPGEDKIFFDVSDEPEACTVSPVFRCAVSIFNCSIAAMGNFKL